MDQLIVSHWKTEGYIWRRDENADFCQKLGPVQLRRSPRLPVAASRVCQRIGHQQELNQLHKTPCCVTLSGHCNSGIWCE